MKLSGNTILVTGGATGIGLALAGSFLERGNEVIICGRRKSMLDEARKKYPRLHVRQCDVTSAKDRTSLFRWISSAHAGLNILVNNAGIQRQVDFREGGTGPVIDQKENEITINLEAPILMSSLFIPLLGKQKEAAIINVSSGLAFVPLAFVPVYCATKAGLHSFTLSLRHQLSETGIRVFEIIPPTTDTDLDGGARDRRGQGNRGIRPKEVAAAAMEGIEKDRYEIPVGMAEGLMKGSRTDPQGIFDRLNAH